MVHKIEQIKILLEQVQEESLTADKLAELETARLLLIDLTDKTEEVLVSVEKRLDKLDPI